MATENHKRQTVRPGGPSEGDWVVVIHDCRTPSKVEIEDRSAAVGTVWQCGGDQGCGDKWKLAVDTRRGTFGEDREGDLAWIRITPKTDTETD